jgi:hypothetical protein
MSNVRRLALLTVFAAATGGIVGVVSIVLEDAAVTHVPREGAEVVPETADDAETANGSDTEPKADDLPAASETAVTRERVISLTQRIDSRDADERHTLALDLLRRGPAALPQARALRPESADGRDLQARLVAALQKMRALRRGGDYARLGEHLRLQLDLDAFATVVPEEYLHDERRDYWTAKLAADRGRAEGGLASDGEVALAELELARVRRDLGELDGAAYGELARRRLPELRVWIDSLRKRRDVPTARVQALDAQADRLEP